MSKQRSALAIGAIAFMLVAGAASVVHAPRAVAQPATIKAGGGDDLRAAFANAADVAEGKRVAEASCASCHGANGVSTSKGVPHLAGQRPAYLYHEFREYQRGARGDAAMHGAVKFLNDDALVKVAAYYASLEPAAPAVLAGGRPAPEKSDPIQAGKAAAAACAGCHGDSGVSKTAGVPSLVGLDPKYLVAAMGAYRSGARKNDAMKAVLSAATDSDIADMALFYALAEARPGADAAGGRPGVGQGCGDGLRRMPRQQRRGHRSGDTQSRRPGCAVSRGGASRVQGRIAR